MHTVWPCSMYLSVIGLFLLENSDWNTLPLHFCLLVLQWHLSSRKGMQAVVPQSGLACLPQPLCPESPLHLFILPPLPSLSQFVPSLWRLLPWPSQQMWCLSPFGWPSDPLHTNQGQPYYPSLVVSSSRSCLLPICILLTPTLSIAMTF